MNASDQFEHEPDQAQTAGPKLVRRVVVVLLVVVFLAGGANLLVPRSATRARSHLNIGWYLRSNQWRADVRSAAAVVRYVLDRGFQPGLNSIATGAVNATVTSDLSQTNSA